MLVRNRRMGLAFGCLAMACVAEISGPEEDADHSQAELAHPGQRGIVRGGVIDIDGVPTPVETAGALPRVYEFQPNFPNPFRTATTFGFALPERAHVELAVYDAAGRLVARLVDEARAPGLHRIPWDASRVASGTYFARLSAGAFTETRRVVLLR